MENIATQYDGTFDLTFLRDGETVRLGDVETRAVYIETPHDTLRVEVGDWLIRRSNGRVIIRRELPE